MPEKLAAPPIASLFRTFGQRALTSGGTAALGGAGGAGIGAVLGGVRGYQRAKEEGSSGLSGALRGGLGGAAAGGALGAAGGTIVGAAGGSRAKEFVGRMSRREGLVGSISRFGERQAHSLTGAMPAGGLKSIGASPKEEAFQAWKAAKERALAGAGRDAAGLSGVKSKTVGSLQKAFGHAAKTEELGMTSLPGAAKAFATKPVQALKAGLGREWYSNPSAVGKVTAIGLPAAFIASDAMRKDNREDNQESTAAERGLSSLGLAAPFSLTPMGFTGATAASMLLGGAGKRVGGMLRKKTDVSPPPEAAGPEDASVAGNVQRELSPRASGGVQ